MPIESQYAMCSFSINFSSLSNNHRNIYKLTLFVLYLYNLKVLNYLYNLQLIYVNRLLITGVHREEFS